MPPFDGINKKRSFSLADWAMAGLAAPKVAPPPSGGPALWEVNQLMDLLNGGKAANTDLFRPRPDIAGPAVGLIVLGGLFFHAATGFVYFPEIPTYEPKTKRCDEEGWKQRRPDAKPTPLKKTLPPLATPFDRHAPTLSTADIAAINAFSRPTDRSVEWESPTHFLTRLREIMESLKGKSSDELTALLKSTRDLATISAIHRLVADKKSEPAKPFSLPPIASPEGARATICNSGDSTKPAASSDTLASDLTQPRGGGRRRAAPVTRQDVTHAQGTRLTSSTSRVVSSPAIAPYEQPATAINIERWTSDQYNAAATALQFGDTAIINILYDRARHGDTTSADILVTFGMGQQEVANHLYEVVEINPTETVALGILANIAKYTPGALEMIERIALRSTADEPIAAIAQAARRDVSAMDLLESLGMRGDTRALTSLQALLDDPLLGINAAMSVDALQVEKKVEPPSLDPTNRRNTLNNALAQLHPAFLETPSINGANDEAISESWKRFVASHPRLMTVVLFGPHQDRLTPHISNVVDRILSESPERLTTMAAHTLFVIGTRMSNHNHETNSAPIAALKQVVSLVSEMNEAMRHETLAQFASLISHDNITYDRRSGENQDMYGYRRNLTPVKAIYRAIHALGLTFKATITNGPIFEANERDVSPPTDIVSSDESSSSTIGVNQDDSWPLFLLASHIHTALEFFHGIEESIRLEIPAHLGNTHDISALFGDVLFPSFNTPIVVDGQTADGTSIRFETRPSSSGRRLVPTPLFRVASTNDALSVLDSLSGGIQFSSSDSISFEEWLSFMGKTEFHKHASSFVKNKLHDQYNDAIRQDQSDHIEWWVREMRTDLTFIIQIFTRGDVDRFTDYANRLKSAGYDYRLSTTFSADGSAIIRLVPIHQYVAESILHLAGATTITRQDIDRVELMLHHTELATDGGSWWQHGEPLSQFADRLEQMSGSSTPTMATEFVDRIMLLLDDTIRTMTDASQEQSAQSIIDFAKRMARSLPPEFGKRIHDKLDDMGEIDPDDDANIGPSSSGGLVLMSHLAVWDGMKTLFESARRLFSPPALHNDHVQSTDVRTIFPHIRIGGHWINIAPRMGATTRDIVVGPHGDITPPFCTGLFTLHVKQNGLTTTVRVADGANNKGSLTRTQIYRNGKPIATLHTEKNRVPIKEVKDGDVIKSGNVSMTVSIPDTASPHYDSHAILKMIKNESEKLDPVGRYLYFMEVGQPQLAHLAVESSFNPVSLFNSHTRWQRPLRAYARVHDPQSYARMNQPSPMPTNAATRADHSILTEQREPIPFLLRDMPTPTQLRDIRVSTTLRTAIRQLTGDEFSYPAVAQQLETTMPRDASSNDWQLIDKMSAHYYGGYNNADADVTTRMLDDSAPDPLDDQLRQAAMAAQLPLPYRARSWYWHNFFSDIDDSHPPKTTGRLYLSLYKNLAAECWVAFHREVEQPLRARGINIEFKMADSQKGLGRADSFVIYFYPHEQQAVYQAVSAFAQQHGPTSSHTPYLKDSTPVFAASVKGANGKRIPGLAFGMHVQSAYTQESFGSLRTKAMARAALWMSELEKEGVKPTIETYEKLVHRAFELYGINPDFPAFDSGKESEFDFLRPFLTYR